MELIIHSKFSLILSPLQQSEYREYNVINLEPPYVKLQQQIQKKGAFEFIF